MDTATRIPTSESTTPVGGNSSFDPCPAAFGLEPTPHQLTMTTSRGTAGPVRIAILTTGGTIEKVYDERDGSLRNAGSVLNEITGALRLPTLRTHHVPVMSKDSLEMTDDDRAAILAAVRTALREDDAVVVVHGTDTLAITGEYLYANLPDLTKPIVLTGAMRPYQFRDTDAHQNLTEALLACRLLSAGIYVAMHNQVLRFPGVTKDRTRGTFVRTA